MNQWKHARIGKQYSFCASHQLTGVPAGHQCAKLHGHNYVVEIEVRGEVSPQTGFICDFSAIDDVMRPLIDKLDHSHLNDTVKNPTAENIAQWILDNQDTKIAFSIKVWETPKCWAQVINAEGLYRRQDKVE